MRPAVTRFAARLLSTCVLAVLAGAEAGAQVEGLFSAVDTDSAAIAHREGNSRAAVPRTIRSRPVIIDLSMLAAARAAVEGGGGTATLTLNLFEDAVFPASVEHSTPTRAGYALTGRLEGVPFGTMALVVNGPVVAGTVRTPTATWEIRSADNGVHLVRAVDLSALPPGAEPLVPGSDDSPMIPPPAFPGADWDRAGHPIPSYSMEGMSIDPESTAGEADPESGDDGSVIDVLVVHTPEAREAEGGAAQIEALVDLWVAETNQAYADSGVIHRIALVGQAETEYEETGEAIPALFHLTDPRDGRMDDVHLLRNAYAADIVNLVYNEAVDACGVAWLMGLPEHKYERYAFTASGRRCGARNFAHELGHAMGLRHDRYQQPNENRPYPYSSGYVNQRAFEEDAPESRRWRTVMAYDWQCRDAGFHCNRLFRFSNPDQTYLGDALGVPGDMPTNAVDGPADARRALNDLRFLIAGFRSSRDRAACKPFFRPERQFVPAEGGTFEASVAIHHDCAWTPATDSAFVTVTAGGGTGSGAFTYDVAVNKERGRASRVTLSGHSFLVEQIGPVNEGICDRTLLVQQALVEIAGADHCWNVTNDALSRVQYLDLRGHRIGVLRTGDFAGLINMHYLGLAQNELTDLPAGVFSGLTGLDSLNLSSNNLTTLPENVFADLSGLLSLVARDNDLNVLPRGAFTGLSSLQALALAGNDLSFLPEEIFADLSSLRNLELGGNRLTVLSERHFTGLDRLQELWLGWNELTELPAGLFAGLSNLQTLVLYHNRLTALPERLFAGLGNLEGLWLRGNELTTLPLFGGSPRLRRLSLGRNPLRTLPEWTFEGLPQLHYLGLAGAELKALPPGIFADQTALKELDLNTNELTELPAGIFSGLPGFTTLALHGNPGAPFTLTLDLVRTEHTTFGGAVSVRVEEGAPFDMVVPLSASGAALSTGAATVGAGQVVGDGVAVARRTRTATVRPGPPPAIPRGEEWCRCRGLRLVAGDSVEFSARAPFTDHPLRPGVTRVRAVHFLELRERIRLLRQDAGLPPFPWTDSMLTPRVTPVRRVHVAELRDALADVYAAVGQSPPHYSDPTLPKETPIRAAHLMELRSAILELE